jgi:DNA-binding NarL/FixJ family response regulator
VLEAEPAWQVFRAELRAFLGEQVPRQVPRPGTLDRLSTRELEILRHAARGLDNDEIAAALHLSTRTVERHLSNAYAKLDLHGKSARTAAVARLLTRA